MSLANSYAEVVKGEELEGRIIIPKGDIKIPIPASAVPELPDADTPPEGGREPPGASIA